MNSIQIGSARPPPVSRLPSFLGVSWPTHTTVASVGW